MPDSPKVTARGSVSGRIVICGTGTEVGKTHVGAALCGAIRRRGHKAQGLKPVESGWSGPAGSDAARLAEACEADCREPLYALARPVSPHLAAREEGVKINLAGLEDWLLPSCGTETGSGPGAVWQVVETAGGLMTPLGPGLTNLDLVVAMGPEVVVLVGADRLGALHDVSVCLLALRSRAIERATIVLSGPMETDQSTGSNAGELERLGIATKVLSFPRAPREDLRTRVAADELAEHLFGAS